MSEPIELDEQPLAKILVELNNLSPMIEQKIDFKFETFLEHYKETINEYVKQALNSEIKELMKRFSGRGFKLLTLFGKVVFVTVSIGGYTLLVRLF